MIISFCLAIIVITTPLDFCISEELVKIKTMGNLHDIHEIQNQVNLYFDNALGENEKQALLQQVTNDPRCSKIFYKEKNLRTCIKNKVTRPSVSSDLIQMIKDRIRVI